MPTPFVNLTPVARLGKEDFGRASVRNTARITGQSKSTVARHLARQGIAPRRDAKIHKLPKTAQQLVRILDATFDRKAEGILPLERLGAALWELDYAFSGSIAGISRFFFHMGKGDFFYSMWEPLPSPLSDKAHINPTYYTMLFAADLVVGLKSPKIAALPREGNINAANFAVYDGNKLRKLVFINLGKHEKAQAVPRQFQIHDVSHTLGKAVSVRRLTGEHSASTTGVSWAGQEIDDSGKVVGQLNLENVYDGLVKVYNSEAVIVEII